MPHVQIHLSNFITINTDAEALERWKRWKPHHEDGPYHLEIHPTGIVDTITLVHLDSGSKIDLTDYENI